MVDSSANDLTTGRVSTIGRGSSSQADDNRQPSSVSEFTQYKLNNENSAHTPSVGDSPAGAIVPTSGRSRGPSSESGVGQIYTEKTRGPSPKRVQYRPSVGRSRGRKSSPKDDVTATMQNGTHHVSMAESAKMPASPKRKKSGLGTVIRRIFGRRSVKNRISLPAPVEHRRHVSLARPSFS